MSDRSRLFVNMFLLYAGTLAIGIFAAWGHVTHIGADHVALVNFTWVDALIFAGVFSVFTFVLLRFIHVARTSLAFFLFVAVLVGAQFVANPWLGWPWDIAVGIVLIIAMRFFRRVAVHDIAIAIGIGGVSALMGMSLTPLIAAGLLAALSVYDIVAVYRTKHMVVMAEQMLSSGAIFGFLVPARPKGFLMPTQQALEAREVMLLGSGDIGLPLVLAASSVTTSLNAAIVVGAMSLAGVMIMQWLFMHQRERRPMAALPPIAAMAILGYLFAILGGL